jgi:predicted nucleic acid-binding protein
MRADYAIILDANILAESAISDLFLRLSEEPRLISPRWTAEIWAEARRTMISRLGWPAEVTESRIAAAQATFPEAMVEDYEGFVAKCTNDPKDRHILAAAIRARVETIVTMNVKHFKEADLAPWGITAAHPGEYLNVLYDHDEGVVVSVLHRMAELRKKTLIEMLSRLSAGIPAFTSHVALNLGLEVPPYSSAAWRNS